MESYLYQGRDYGEAPAVIHHTYSPVAAAGTHGNLWQLLSRGSLRRVQLPTHRGRCQFANIQQMRGTGRKERHPPGRPGPPSQEGNIAASATRVAEGERLSVFNHKAALLPLVSFVLSPDQHFDKSMEM